MSEKIILFGAGKYGKAAVHYYGEENIAYFVDNNTAKWGMRIFGIEVISPEALKELLNEEGGAYRLVITGRVYREIARQLEDMGIQKYELYSDDSSRRYYPATELVFNSYEENAVFSEKEWNTQMQNSPLQSQMRQMVDELYQDVPLFNHIEIETVNRCNGTCAFCPVSVGNDIRERKVMEKALFEKIIGELSELEYEGRIALFSNNEPMLDDRIIDFYRYARERLPKAWFHMFTNGTLLTLDKCKALLPYLDELIIDNYDQELKLIPNSRKIKEYCEEHPELREKVSIVLRKPNEVLTTRGGDAPNRKERASYPDATCVLPFKQMIVRPDGKISLCCNDPYGKYTMGDASKDSLKDIWYGKKYQGIRAALNKGRGEVPHCIYCDTFNFG